MNTLARRYGLPARIFSAAAQRACQQHSWPGNLSEMEKFVKRYLVMGAGSLADIFDPRYYTDLEGGILANGRKVGAYFEKELAAMHERCTEHAKIAQDRLEKVAAKLIR